MINLLEVTGEDICDIRNHQNIYKKLQFGGIATSTAPV